MKKQPEISTIPELGKLVSELRGLIESARTTVATTVNSFQVLTNFEIGRRIVEHEQQGAERAEYGKELLEELSARLTGEFGKGFSLTNLKLMRKFFVEYRSPFFGDFLPDNGRDQFPAFVCGQFNFIVLGNAAALLF